jgi:hypothetical protein
MVVTGKANEQISAVFPLYISKEHWEIANKLNRFTLGWLCTLDVYGYDYKQLLSTPFMILHKMIKDLIYHPLGRTDSRINNIFQMLRTTKQIIKNNKLNIDTIFDAYKKPELRTAEHIKNNKILLAQMLFTK